MTDTYLKDFFFDEDWDAPFFKRLALNDTGQAVGHQAGIVLPKDLREYLPSLDEAIISAKSPTTDRYLHAQLYIGLSQLIDSDIRYQFQTWGGTRSPESRITDGLRPLWEQAAKGDLLIFQRRADSLHHFRILLVKSDSPEFAVVNKWVVSRRWGKLFETEEPVSQSKLSDATKEIEIIEEQEFQIINPEVVRVESRQSRIARSSVFRERVGNEYNYSCAVSGIRLSTPSGLCEVESAHVIPVKEGGTDDIRNGIALTRTLHWAFDHGLWGILPNREVYIPEKVRLMSENDFLMQFKGKVIYEAKTEHLKVHKDAFDWHIENRVNQWK